MTDDPNDPRTALHQHIRRAYLQGARDGALAALSIVGLANDPEAVLRDVLGSVSVPSSADPLDHSGTVR